MAKAKEKALTDAEKALLRRKGMQPLFWALIQRKPDYIIVKNVYTGEVRVVHKIQIPN